jgi:4,5-dihydroxyphthalate decarboxylase
MDVTLACGRYDRTQALMDGRVRIEGVERLTYLPLKPGDTFWRQLNHEEFDVSEMSLSSYAILRSEGDERFVAVPVFPSRVFRHSAMYLPMDSGIQAPADLKGKRVGVGDYQMTAAVWTRGYLQHEYGVRPDDMTWVVGAPIRSIAAPPGVPLEMLSPGSTLEAMLGHGAIDALVSVVLPHGLGTRVRRLFPDFRRVEAAYYRKTGIFPIMHTLAIRRRVYEANPWLAVSLHRAFCQARDLAYRWLYDIEPVSLPWITGEIEETRAIFGSTIWDYSIDGSRATLDALVAYLDEQRLTRRRMSVEELFVPNVGPGLDAYLRATGED